jgi:MSHA biogenesis protein MshI
VRIPFLMSSRGKGRVGIELGGNKIALVHMVGDVIKHCHYDFVDDPEERQKIIESFVNEHQLKGQPCTLVLHPRCYQLLLTDKPEVEDDEVAGALPWKVKDLLHYPLEDVLLQHFMLPEDAFSRRQQMLYVVAVPKAALDQMADMIEAADLHLDSVDVTELVLSGGVIGRREPQKNTGVLYVDSRQGVLCLGQKHSLYLSRGVDTGMDTLVPSLKQADTGSLSASPKDAFLLDVQRSLDYYESQQGKGPVVELCCLPTGVNQERIISFLKENLTPDIQPLSFDDLMECDGPFSAEDQQHCMLAALAAKRWLYHGSSAFSLGG